MNKIKFDVLIELSDKNEEEIIGTTFKVKYLVELALSPPEAFDLKQGNDEEKEIKLLQLINRRMLIRQF